MHNTINPDRDVITWKYEPINLRYVRFCKTGASEMRPSRPLILVVGCTGTGKSELAVALALRHNGEIVNGDALQLYKGLPIVTNKLAEPLRKGIPHHLLDCVGLDEQPWTVRQYHKHARSVIDEIRSRKKLPIVVGGTNYYVQSLVPTANSMLPHGPTNEGSTSSIFPILDAQTSDMYRELHTLDPVTAARIHPNDRRKIQRGLEICLQNGRPASQVYQDRHDRKSPSVDKDVLSQNRDDLLVFWTHASPPDLNQRINARVDQMMSRGLLEEVEKVYEHATDCKAKGTPIDESHGIWTAIGFKEFLPLFSLPKQTLQTEAECIERTKIATRQYAKRQNRWLRLTFVPALSHSGYSQRIYVLDASDASRFSESAEDPAIGITERYLAGGDLPPPDMVSSFATDCLGQEKPIIQARRCEICEKTLMTEQQWKGHLSSKGHRSATRPKVAWQARHEISASSS